MQGAKGLCPDGWHIPTDAEWTILTEYLGGESVAGGMMKSTHGWNNNGNGSNSSGYTAFPGGTRNSDNSYSNLWNNANFWSSTETNLPSAWGRFLTSDYPAVGRSSDNKADGFSCRCLKD
jgi:uncharacterized protein (TIGR02145 family)